MKWINKAPSCNQIRYVKRFALFPVKLINNYWIWMEFYYQRQSSHGWHKWVVKMNCPLNIDRKDATIPIKYIRI